MKEQQQPSWEARDARKPWNKGGLAFVMAALLYKRRNCLMSIMGAKSALTHMDRNQTSGGSRMKRGPYRLTEGEFLVGTHTSSNILPIFSQLIKSGTLPSALDVKLCQNSQKRIFSMVSAAY